jgi:uridine kinase
MEPTVAILVCGHLRSYFSCLHKYFSELPPNFHIYLHLSSSDDSDRFLNFKQVELDNDPHIKRIDHGDFVGDTGAKTQREINTIQQWYKIKSLFEKLEDTYSVVVRCRTDMNFDCDIETFITTIYNTRPNTIYIPKNYDIFDTRAVDPACLSACINDQFAYGDYESMRHYCRLFETVVRAQSPLISECLLYSHLQCCRVERVELPYRLVLSNVYTISICGDSGSGKSTLASLIQKTLFFDNTLVFETDRYHKWERGSEHYKTFTHLHPYANNLEKLSEDVYRLRLGDSIHAIDYDHSTGKFTPPTCVEPKPFLVVCGLHTLYKNNLRELSDLKIFIDTDTDLKIKWKVERDASTRGATVETVRNTIALRKKDDCYISEQMSYADLIICYKQSESIEVRFKIRKEWFAFLQSFYPLLTIHNEASQFVEFTVDPSCVHEFKLPNGVSLNPGMEGTIQLVVAKLIWNF